MESRLFSALLEIVWQRSRAAEYAARYAELDLAHLRGQRSTLEAIGDLFSQEEKERAEQAEKLQAIIPLLPTSGNPAALAEQAMVLAGISAMRAEEHAFYRERQIRAEHELNALYRERQRHGAIA